MKTIKKNKEVKRVSDAQAETLTKEGWKYVPKSEWRKVQGCQWTHITPQKPAPKKTKKKVSKKNDRKAKS